MSWQTQLKGDSLSWLLEPVMPEVRYLALRDLLDRPQSDSELRKARETAHLKGHIPNILDKMEPSGFWKRPGPGYGPKYRSTVWSIILLAQLGASIDEDARIGQACNYLVNNALTSTGQFSYSTAPSGTIDCLQGNLLWSLLELGFEDPRLEVAYDWMSRTITGEGIAAATDRKAPVRYYANKCGPNFACGANNGLPCAWGGNKVMLALGKLPEKWRTPVIERAIQQGVDFFLNTDLVGAAFPSGYNDKPSSNWWKFGFPVFYITDLLQVAEALALLGFGTDPRLTEVIKLILSKQDENGRWLLEYDYSGKTWGTFGGKNLPNKWVTLRALRVLKAAG